MRIVQTVCLLVFLGPATALSDDLLACVDPDVRSALLSFGHRSGIEITDEMPERYSTVRFPDVFDFIGSMTSEYYVTVAFRTSVVPDRAESLMMGLLGKQGWRRMPQRNESRPGFQPSHDQLRRRVSLCHPDGDSIAIMTRDEGRGTVVTLFGTHPDRGGDCNRQFASESRMDRGVTNEIMPNLQLPANSRSRGSGHGGIIRASGDDADTHVRVLTDLQPEAVHEHFAGQLTTQGWLRDSSWVGELSLGSTWSLSREGLPKTVASLQVIKHSDGDYSAKFSMLAL